MEADLSLADARRIAIAAQGLHLPRPKRVDARTIAATIRRLGLLQIDPVNVVEAAHNQVLFSRLGPHDRSLLRDLVYRKRAFVEHWAHEACIVPMESWPLLAYRRDTHRPRPYAFGAVLARNRPYLEAVLAQVRDHGPLSAEHLPEMPGTPQRMEHAWFGSVQRAVLEAAFGTGQLAVADRRADFSRSFDLVERIVPEALRAARVPPDEARRRLLLQAARAHGLGTVSDLADYFRMPVGEARPRVAELVEAGALAPVRVEGFREPAYLHPEAERPRRGAASALLSPFDPLIWFRPRTRRLFAFDYRFEIFVPREKRRWGAYVLPFLHGDRLVARVDLKADRPAGTLRVLGSYGEPGASDEALQALAAELRLLAGFCGLDEVWVGRRGDLARPLGAAVRALVARPALAP